jgi:hypothetical protein
MGWPTDATKLGLLNIGTGPNRLSDSVRDQRPPDREPLTDMYVDANTFSVFGESHRANNALRDDRPIGIRESHKP